MRGLCIWRMTIYGFYYIRQELQKELEEKREEEEPSLLFEILSFKIERAGCPSL